AADPARRPLAARYRSRHAGRLVADFRRADDLLLLLGVPPAHGHLAHLIGRAEPRREADELVVTRLAPLQRGDLRARLLRLAEIQGRVLDLDLVAHPPPAHAHTADVRQVVL